MSEPQGFPLWNQPFTYARTGLITQAWRQFLLTLWSRSGGSSDVIVDLELLGAIPGGPAVDAAARKMAEDAFLMALLPKPDSEGDPLEVQWEGVAVDSDVTTLNFTGSSVAVTQTSPGIVEANVTSWIPLVDGAEPPVFITDGAGVLILVAY